MFTVYSGTTLPPAPALVNDAAQVTVAAQQRLCHGEPRGEHWCEDWVPAAGVSASAASRDGDAVGLGVTCTTAGSGACVLELTNAAILEGARAELVSVVLITLTFPGGSVQSIPVALWWLVRRCAPSART